MTPAEFRCAREYLGLSCQWVAEKLRVNTRTVSGWEEGRNQPPDYAVEFLTGALEVAAQTVGTLTVKWAAQKGQRPLPVPRGEASPHGQEFPAQYYRRIASRVSERSGVTVDYDENSPQVSSVASAVRRAAHRGSR